ESKNTQDEGGCQRGQRHIATDRYDSEPDQQRGERRARQQHADRTRCRGHSFAAAESQINRVQMPQESRRRRRYRQSIRRQLRFVRGAPPLRQHSRQSALGEVEQEDEDAKWPSQYAANVGGADVATTLLQNVHAAPARNQIAEGNRASEIGKERGYD